MNAIRHSTRAALGRTFQITEIGAPVLTSAACHALVELIRNADRQPPTDDRRRSNPVAHLETWAIAAAGGEKQPSANDERRQRAPVLALNAQSYVAKETI